MREVVGDHGEEALAPAMGVTLRQVAEFSGGQSPLDELLSRTRAAMGGDARRPPASGGLA